MNAQMVETLKGATAYFAAGAVAYSLGQPCTYGCHYGMASDRQAAAVAFGNGYYAAMSDDIEGLAK